MDGDVERAPGGFLGRSQAAVDVREFVRRAAKIDCSVLITGESGVGKELVAREIHDHSPRKEQIFFALNCAAIPESLFESEVFGHEAGAYTGAQGAHRGIFERSEGGTLFLDEIGDLALAQQPKLLRVLESRELVRVGGERTRQFDIRVIAATNHDLGQMCGQGDFRRDLYYRLRVLEISVPPLRHRDEDIPDLVSHFMTAISRKYGIEIPRLSQGSMAKLRSKQWPGNVRELQHSVERAMALNSQEVLRRTCFESGETSPTSLRRLLDRDWKTARREFEGAYVRNLLKRHEGDVQKAARAAGLAPGSIYRILRRLGLGPPPGRDR
jgi:transcriptional regulator with PAS, ATPase and Fis domain